jgi:hypothetical protein
MNEATQLANRLMEQFGYIVIKSWLDAPLSVGGILPGLTSTSMRGGELQTVDGPLIVASETDEDDYREQYEWTACLPPYSPGSSANRYFRVVTE